MRIFVILILLNLGCLELVKGQTYVQPILGYGLLKTTSSPNQELRISHVVSDDHFNNGFLLYGLGITQHIFERFSLQLQYKRSRRTLQYNDRGIIGYSNFRFGLQSVSLIPKVKFLKDFELGVGFNYNDIHKVQLGFEDRDRWSEGNKYYDQTQTGWVIMMNYNYKDFILALEYMNSKSINLNVFSEISRLQSIELSIRYNIDVWNKSKRAN